MKIFVCVKQVPDTRGRVSLKKDGSLDRSRMATIINPDDLGAVEAALKIKDKNGAEVVAVTMGPPMAGSMLHELYAMGVDRTILITARELVGSDTYGTSSVLAAVIKDDGIGEDDIILCGRQAIDGDTAQVGPEMAEKLGISQLTCVSGMEFTAEGVICKCELEDGYMSVKTHTPCLISCMQKIETPRYMGIRRIFDWDDRRDMRTVTYQQLQDMPIYDDDVVGIQKSPTIVSCSFALPQKTNALILEGTGADMSKQLFGIMDDRHVFG